MNRFIAGLIFLFYFGSVQAAFPKVPDIKKDCSICHLVHKGGRGALLIRPLPDLCTGCHPDRTGAGEHLIGVKPANDTPSSLPLDKRGEITCTTCHAPHGEGDFPKMLRKNPDELCIACHKK
jgi:predicted CXXCH cytochrome family protein